ncbi:response regulator transcription factor [Arthrobacter sp. ISL-5]|uniref:response regulator transcription factor n=1 Tax=Arthrobacter sp. ISL-5 TaxID=2819111 RepID=UPI001BE9F4EA|nr:response regulator transcription factor [Arthrobacter sp. ISL-5]MBT2552928.1 response regulator transcription factor [Arthrobacter sp. ISL-5]
MNDRRVVVVIEQDEAVRALLRATLGDAGFEVHFAATGESGVELVRAKRPDTVTLDVVLPDMNGYEVARRIREFSHTYIIILTARSDLRATIKGFEAGADDYIVKPIRPRELRARVDGMLRRPRQLRTVAPVRTAPGRTATATAAAAAAKGAAAPTATAGSSFEHNGLRIDSATRAASIGGRSLALTRTEFDLLRILLERGTGVVTKAELAALLGLMQQEAVQPGAAPAGTRDAGRIIEAHVGNLRRKLGDDARRPRWLKTVRGSGYTLA